MKTIALALVVILAGVNALPQAVHNAHVKDERILDGIISGILDNIIQLIKDRDLDPFVVDYVEGEYNFNDIFSAQGFVKNFVFSGLSDINVNDISFAGGFLNIDLELPLLEASVGTAAGEVSIFSRNINGAISGRLAIKGLRIAAKLNLDFSGYILEDLELGFRLGGIESELNVIISGRDISDQVNDFLGNRLPTVLIENEELLNKIIADIIQFVINRLS